MTKVDGD
ncbi:Protein of unknown function [Lactobacillus delbrueckii subsp. lactis]|nr:Protein of unknown function [Lactobacillus delbrueckii subsp. lactis]